jgi:tRNA-splicing ligase RtcB
MKQISEAMYEIERAGDMRVPARIYATSALMEKIQTDRSLGQLRNVATLPGIVSHACAMPDCHEGYGFPIGGVAAFDLEHGVISPGGVGYDINCGVRLIATNLTKAQILSKQRELVDKLFTNVPSGVGSTGKLRLTESELDHAITEGVPWAIAKGYGYPEDALKCEEGGRIDGADPSLVTPMAKKRGRPQLGTLGAGNHFLEIQEITQVVKPDVAKKFGLEEGKACVMIHSGSRGFGHQVCDDNLRIMLDAARRYGIMLPDRELCCAPIKSREAENYLGAMRCAVNFAFINRHVMMHWVRETFDSIYGKGTGEQMPLVYDVCHNIAKFEEHDIDGKRTKVCVHRKGATRAFAAGRSEIPQIYRDVGQPVLIPGTMGTASYVLVGQPGGMKETFGSSCHGAGRAMSRKRAVESWGGKDVQQNLSDKGIMIKATEMGLIAEEAPAAYKDVGEVVRAVELAGISGIVAKMVPIAVVKG